MSSHAAIRFAIAVLLTVLASACGTTRTELKPDPGVATPAPALASSVEPAWTRMGSGKCPPPYEGYCATGRASAHYSSSAGAAAASARASAALTRFLQMRVQAYLDDGIAESPDPRRPRSAELDKQRVRLMTAAMVGGITIPVVTYSASLKPGSPGDYVALAQVSRESVMDARDLIADARLSQEEARWLAEDLHAFAQYLEGGRSGATTGNSR